MSFWPAHQMCTKKQFKGYKWAMHNKIWKNVILYNYYSFQRFQSIMLYPIGYIIKYSNKITPDKV